MFIRSTSGLVRLRFCPGFPVLDHKTFEQSLESALVQAFGALPERTQAEASKFAVWSSLSAAVAPLMLARDDRLVAISGCQGSGKSSLAEVLAATLNQLGQRAVAVSIDDFYLGKAARQQLAREVHPLLATRGVPGTHDVAWLRRVLEALNAGAGEIEIPRFDKGVDDRAGVERAAVNVLIVEGWCMGVQPQSAADLDTPVNALEADEDADGTWRRWVNEQISCHYLPLWGLIPFWIHLRAPHFSVVRQWRGAAETALPMNQRMNAAALTRFVAHYERLTRAQLAQPPLGPGLMLALDEAHGVTEITAADASRI